MPTINRYVRLTPEEDATLRALAAKADRTVAGLLRVLITTALRALSETPSH